MIRNLALFMALAGAASPAFARQSYPIEPVPIPPSIQQGIDLIYVDPGLVPAIKERDALLEDLGIADRPGAAVDLFASVSPIYTDLRRGLAIYRSTWSHLPQLTLEPGPTLRKGAVGERVARLRERLGLPAGDRFDEDLAIALRRYQQAHGLGVDGAAGSATISSLNLGAQHYERRAMLNMERAMRLPPPSEEGRYILVDSGEARLYMYEGGRLLDSMKVIVGKAATPTPMMAALIRYAYVNPYWNVPPDLAQSLIAPRVVAQGLNYLQAQRYEVLADWSEDSPVVEPVTIDWPAVARGEEEIRVRQLPGAGNSMGDIKFMMPNDFGIYLHDTPDRALFERTDRWISNGCVRLEDAQRLARWLFGTMPRGDDPSTEQQVDLEAPVPVYLTYLTAVGTPDGIEFRSDPYGRDAQVISSLAAGDPQRL